MGQHWVRKFVTAARGIRTGIVGQSSFHVHLPVAGLVLLVAWLLKCSAWQWCVLGLCVGLVLALELINSAIEYLARGLCDEHNESVGKALDTSAGAVLIASLAAATIGGSIFAGRLWSIISGN